jgi:hypothetical protein
LFLKFKLEFPFLKPGPKAELVLKSKWKRQIVVGGNEGDEDSDEREDGRREKRERLWEKRRKNNVKVKIIF